jgi:hypothetical protein
MPKYVKNIPLLYSGSKKCPPGVICLENMTMFFIVLMIALLIYYFSRQSPKTNEKIIIQEKIQKPAFINALVPNYPYTNQPDVLLDPYAPPLRDERYLVPIPARIPINVQTNIGAVDTNYRQVGILTPLNMPNKDNILSLMGRPVFNNRDLWQYYTISNQHNNVKLPISVNGKSGSNEYGVNKLYNGDTVYVEGYNNAFRVTIYDNDVIRYLPVV